MIVTVENAPQQYARIAGLFYLAIIVLGLFGEVFVRGALVVSGDPTATANAITASPLLWRAGIAGDLLMHVFDLPVIVILYFLLKPVHHGLALFATLVNLIQTAVLAMNKLTLLAPLFLLEGGNYLASFSPAQLHALSYLAIKAHSYGFGIGLIFFGITCLARGYLMVKSGLWPKALGVLMFVAGISYLINSFALILAPSIASMLFPAILMPAFVAELAFSLWLIVKGLNIKQWERVATQAIGPKPAP